MASRVVMPKLTDTMEEGVLLAWKKREGDLVQAGEALAGIETDKAIMDLEAFASGILRKFLVQDGATVMSGTLIGVIGGVDEDITSALTDTITDVDRPGQGETVATAGIHRSHVLHLELGHVRRGKLHCSPHSPAGRLHRRGHNSRRASRQRRSSQGGPAHEGDIILRPPGAGWRARSRLLERI